MDSGPNRAIAGKAMAAKAPAAPLSPIVAVAAPAFAGTTPKTEAACKKAGMNWDATAKKCSKGM